MKNVKPKIQPKGIIAWGVKFPDGSISTNTKFTKMEYDHYARMFKLETVKVMVTVIE